MTDEQLDSKIHISSLAGKLTKKKWSKEATEHGIATNSYALSSRRICVRQRNQLMSLSKHACNFVIRDKLDIIHEHAWKHISWWKKK